MQTNHLLLKLISAGLREKIDHPHVTGEEAQEAAYIRLLNHCVILPLLSTYSARLLEVTGD